MPVLLRAPTDHPPHPRLTVLVPGILGFLFIVGLFCIALHRWLHQDDTKTFEEIAAAVRSKRPNTVTSRVSNGSIDAENLRGALHKAVRSMGSVVRVRSPSVVVEEGEDEVRGRGEDGGGDGEESARMESVDLSSPDTGKEMAKEGDDECKEKNMGRKLSILSPQRPRRVSMRSMRSEGADSVDSVATWGSVAAPANWVLRWDSRKRNTGK